MLEQVEIGNRVEDADPADDELTNIVIVVEHLLAVAIQDRATKMAMLNKTKKDKSSNPGMPRESNVPKQRDETL